MSLFQSQRQKEIFEAVVRDYIRTGEPVGSKNLASRFDLSLSPASIRKVLAELESLGLLSQAHASAGRAPTEQGFKAYVDHIVKADSLSPGAREAIDGALAAQEAGEAPLFGLLTRLLTEITSQVGLVMAPSRDKLWLKRVYFVRLGHMQVLAVLITENGVIQNRLLRPTEDYSQDELNEVNVYLEDLEPPYALDEIKTRLIEAMGREKSQFEEIFQRVLNLAAEAQQAMTGENEPESDIYVDDEGRGRLMDHPDFKDVQAMRALFRAFENKRRLIELLNEVTGGGRVRVVLGPSGQGADGLALVASPYSGGLHGSGALGVIGPRRLNYSEIVPVVDYAARVVSSLLSRQ
ncbi:MAG: heat-inducible transcriptional repressor HrcA [Deltaproteobacteria bacterium]|jgi:heat-inducible transcriptional repressor|nr:heat-inducible transcriptional repressor HrcA [Deltaproteobacteria bacterium]